MNGNGSDHSGLGRQRLGQECTGAEWSGNDFGQPLERPVDVHRFNFDTGADQIVAVLKVIESAERSLPTMMSSPAAEAIARL